LDLFGRERVMILILEEFTPQPVEHCQRIFEFLGVEPGFAPEIRVHNKAGGILDVPPFWRDPASRRKLARFLISGKFVSKLPHLSRNLIFRRRVEPLSPLARQELLRRCTAEIRRLESLLGRDLHVWLQPADGSADAESLIDPDS
jgi:hypothetical protein